MAFFAAALQINAIIKKVTTATLLHMLFGIRSGPPNYGRLSDSWQTL